MSGGDGDGYEAWGLVLFGYWLTICFEARNVDTNCFSCTLHSFLDGLPLCEATR